MSRDFVEFRGEADEDLSGASNANELGASNDDQELGGECAGCLELLNASCSPVSTSCAHVFCRDCIADWIARTPSCPMCREPLVLDVDTPSGQLSAVPLQSAAAASSSRPPAELDGAANIEAGGSRKRQRRV